MPLIIMSFLQVVQGSTVYPAPTTLGQFIYGGYYAGSYSLNGLNYALILSDKAYDALRDWGIANTTTGVTGQVDGAANSATLGASGAYQAAQFATNLVLNGFSDWYLPSSMELLQVIANLNPTITTLPAELRTGGAQCLRGNYYFSSTEHSAEHALGRQIGSTTGWLVSKNFAYVTTYSRPIRKVRI